MAQESRCLAVSGGKQCAKLAGHKGNHMGPSRFEWPGDDMVINPREPLSSKQPVDARPSDQPVGRSIEQRVFK